MSNGARVPREDALDVSNDVVSRAFQTFAFYHWHWLERGNPALRTDVQSHTVKNAALESSLMAVRDLDDFFRTPGRHDDVRASDFGFPATGGFLTADEREGINKKLAHLTYRAVHERRQAPTQPNPRTWNNADLVTRAMTSFLAFLNHLETVFFATDTEQQHTVRVVRRTIDNTMANIRAIARQELEFTA